MTIGHIQLASKQLADAIDAYCVRLYSDDPRSHLGASIVGGDCARQMWSDFRWLKHKQFDARMLRLFNRGHREEIRYIEWLRGIGWTVWDKDPNTGKQFTTSRIHAHYGGSPDAIAYPTADFPIQEHLICEFKTKATGSSFNALAEKGLRIANPQHFAQMSVYGLNFNIRYGAYFSINKNDDSLHIEIVELDWQLARDLEERALTIIAEQDGNAVPKISLSPVYHRCKMCTYHGICHASDVPEKNCRSCINAVPAENGQWLCKAFNQIIPDHIIKVGCDYWQRII